MFFNRVSFKENWGYAVSPKEAQQRSDAMLQVLKNIPHRNLSFQPVKNSSDTWIGRFTAPNEQIAYKAEVGDRFVVEVVDAKPDKCGWDEKDGDILSVERLIGIYDKQKGAGKAGTIFMRLSPFFRPSVNLITSDDQSNYGFIDNRSVSRRYTDKDFFLNQRGFKRKVRKLLHEIERKIPNPPWAADFKRREPGSLD